MTKKAAWAILALVLLTAASAAAQEGGQEEKMFAGRDIGVIFNTDNLLLDYESYQGGIGLKLADSQTAWRVLLDVFYSTVSDSMAFTLGGAWERHFAEGRVSPYFGAYLQAGYAQMRTEFSSDTWTRISSVPVAFGGIFGVEVFLLRFLSLFAEYDLSLSLDYVRTRESILGTETTDSTFDWTVEVGSGNQSKIGIVFYFRLDRELELERIGGAEQNR